jgi:hypothetical protein
MATYYFRNTGNTSWGVSTNWSLTSGGGATGAVPTATDTANIDTNSGACNMNISGVCAVLNCTGYTSTLTLTNGLTVSGNITLASGMTIAGSGTITINAAGTITTNTIIIPNLTILVSSGIVIFADNCNVSGNLGLGSISSNSYTINGNSIFIGGNLTINSSGGTISGTTTLVMNGTGTWSHSGNTIISNSITFNTSGTITLSGTLYYNTGTITYISGNIICDSTLTLNIQGSCTLSTNIGVIWTNISCLTQLLTITLGSDVYTKKFTYGGPGGNNNQILTLNNNTLYLGSLIQNGSTAINSTLSGTTTLYFNGTGYNTISIPGNANSTFLNQITVNNNIIINTTGTLAIVGLEPFCYGGGTLTYLAGNVYSNITRNTSYSNNYPTHGPTSIMTDFYINGNCTLVNIHKIPFKSIQIAGGSTVTMNQFFNGTPKNPTYIQSSNTTNYTIQFQDSFEKLSNFIKISNCTLTRPLQLLITTKDANKGNNIGIRYINQLPNGIARKTTTIPTNLAGSDVVPMWGGLVADPNTVF